MTDLRDLTDNELLCDLIGGTFTATDAAELSRRLVDLRAGHAEAENEVGRLTEAMKVALAYLNTPDPSFGVALDAAFVLRTALKKAK